ncbi:MAG: primosomal protein N' [Cardiobacteriaceae bacterium]|nr:primosomal protein N' [Cardiobacteriaceae bacterium]
MSQLDFCFDSEITENSAQEEKTQARNFVCEIDLLVAPFARYSYVSAQELPPNLRVLVPLGKNRRVLGMSSGICRKYKADTDSEKLKSIAAVVDTKELISEKNRQFLQYLGTYYQANFGEVLALALPNLLLDSKKITAQDAVFRTQDEIKKNIFYRLTAAGEQALSTKKIGKKQRQCLEKLTNSELPQEQIADKKYCNELEIHGWIAQCEEKTAHEEEKIELNSEQNAALNVLAEKKDFSVSVLYGVTGSGKTEVYIAWIRKIISSNPQAQILLLAPEIALADTLYRRLRKRLTVEIALEHSAKTNQQRFMARKAVKNGQARVLIGTRSAIFADFAALDAVIVDECHDLSYKQMENLRYNARDMAIAMAKLRNIPVLLGSATPLLETWRQIEDKNWQLITLENRALTNQKAEITLDNIRDVELIDGFSARLLREINRRLQNKEQVLLFLNRRGYAPVLFCSNCDWKSECTACDCRMIAHLDTAKMHCHHCGRVQNLPIFCPQCGADDLRLLGFGTQRVEQALMRHFPKARVLRVDTDNAGTHKQFRNLISQIADGEVDLIIGTQWLSKGHHFPNLQMVAVLDADSAFYSQDYRAEERLAQMLVQVGGRAGRESRGHIWIQTSLVEKEVFQVLNRPYQEEAKRQLAIRKMEEFPPYCAYAFIFALHSDVAVATDFLSALRQEIANNDISDIEILGPIPALMSRKNRKYRVELLIKAGRKAQMQRALPEIRKIIAKMPKKSAVAVYFDVDPLVFE